MKIIVVLGAILLWQAVVSRGQCPNTDHCIGTHPRCTIGRIQDTYCFTRVLEQLNSSGKMMTILENTTLPSGLPNEAFKYTKFQILIFRNFDFKTLSSSTDSPFAGATNLKKLYFWDPISPIRNWQYHHLSALQLTDLEFSRIPDRYFNIYNRLPEAFKEAGTNYIRNLKISSSCLNDLMPYSLSTFHNLEKLSLVGNRLKTIGRNVLPSSPNKLKSIDLSANNIITLVPPEFWNPNLPSLREVILTNNLLSTIHSSFVPKSMEKFYINGNKLNCCPELSWIVEINKTVLDGPVGPAATCLIPPKFKGYLLSTLKKEDYLNADC